MLKIEFNNQQTRHKVDRQQLMKAARMILEEAGIETATISLAVVDDPTIHQLNVRFLQHDYPTDVLSFVLEQTDELLDGEVIVSADTAASSAAEYGWRTADELLLYVIHGMLHLVGYDDKSPSKRREMRAQERHFLSLFGLQHRYDE